MLRKTPLRRHTNAKDVSHYRNKVTGEEEIHVGLDREHPTNHDLEFVFSEALDNPQGDAKNDQNNSNNAEVVLEMVDDELPELALSPVLRRTVGFDSEMPVKNRLMINSQNILVDGVGLDHKHITNEDLKPASPVDRESFSIFKRNNPTIPELKKVESFKESQKKYKNK